MLSIAAALVMLPPPLPPSSRDVLAAEDTGWREIRQNSLLYMDVNEGTVLIELFGWFAPENTRNIFELVNAGHFDGGTIDRVQENYVVQWSGPEGAPRGNAVDRVPGESVQASEALDPIPLLPFGDVYAPAVGHWASFPVARDGENIWLTHCYGMVGVGRGEDVDGADGSELYVVIGQAPRHLDRNITLVGMVRQGMEHLTSLPRGSGALGFYGGEVEKPAISSIRHGSDVPPDEQIRLEVLDSAAPSWSAWVDARANRKRDGWFTYSHNAVDLCNLPIPVRRIDSED